MELIDIKMPENCMECDIRAWESGEEMYYCPITGVVCLSVGRQDACPLKELPEKHVMFEWLSEGDYLRASGWNNCLDYINNISERE